jgi:hypothetical protein
MTRIGFGETIVDELVMRVQNYSSASVASTTRQNWTFPGGTAIYGSQLAQPHLWR